MAAKTFEEFIHSTYICEPPFVELLKECWFAAIASAEEKFNSSLAPTNSDYATALRTWNEFKHYSSIHRNLSYLEFLNKRLNAEVPHSA